jgi:hypothetical protein
MLPNRLTARIEPSPGTSEYRTPKGANVGSCFVGSPPGPKDRTKNNAEIAISKPSGVGADRASHAESASTNHAETHTTYSEVMDESTAEDEMHKAVSETRRSTSVLGDRFHAESVAVIIETPRAMYPGQRNASL